MSTATAKIVLGPQDDGRRMSLADFENAEGAPGYQYELSRGVVTVMEVPNPRHELQIDAIRDQLSAYKRAHPGRIYLVAGGSGCKVLLQALQSERHPDIGIYKHPPDDPDARAEDLWSTWLPDIVIEVVSPGSSEQRDYGEKREEYLRFGVRE